jgi:transposase InsO family protein
MDERMKFIADCLRGELPMMALCEQYGISRKTGYKWLGRYRADPEGGLADRSRAPHHPAQGIDEAVAAAIVELRQQHPYWGPRKLLVKLEQRYPEQRRPAASTVGNLLRREGLSRPRRQRRRAPPLTTPLVHAQAANDVWCADFKGWFRTARGERCDPLTISDAHSRFLIECRIVAPTTEGVLPCFEQAFRTYGLPRALRTDNGPPFATTGAGGLSRLSVEWVKLGIKLERITPGKPQENGRHERMHRTLKEDTTKPPAASVEEQQARFARFRETYNCERPHEALGLDVPAAHYSPSPRPYRVQLEDPWYDADHAVRRVRQCGTIKWGGEQIFISNSLVGELVGVAETGAGDWIVRFADIDLGTIDRRTRRLRRFSAARPGSAEAALEQTEKTVTHVPGPNCHL